ARGRRGAQRCAGAHHRTHGRHPQERSVTHYARIIGTGSYLPAKVLTNRDLEATVDTTDEWIHTRTGIRQRHVAAPEEVTSDLALHASRRALEAAGVEAADI